MLGSGDVGTRAALHLQVDLIWGPPVAYHGVRKLDNPTSRYTAIPQHLVLVVKRSNNGNSEALLDGISNLIEVHWGCSDYLAVLGNLQRHSSRVGVGESNCEDFQTTEWLLAKNAVLIRNLETERGRGHAGLATIEGEQVGVDSVAHALEPGREHVALGVERIRGRETKAGAVGGVVVSVVPRDPVLAGHLPRGVDEDVLGVAQHAGDSLVTMVVGLELDATLERGVFEEEGAQAAGDQDAAVLEVVVLVVGGAPVSEVLGLLVVDDVLAVHGGMVAELDVTDVVSSNEHVVVVPVVPDGCGQTTVRTIGPEGCAISTRLRTGPSIDGGVSDHVPGVVIRNEVGAKASVSVAGVTLHTAEGEVHGAYLSIREATTIGSERGVEEDTVEGVRRPVANEVVGVRQTPVGGVVVSTIGLAVVGTWDGAPLPWPIVRVRAYYRVVLYVVEELVSVLNVDSSTADIIKRVLCDGGKVGIVYDNAALVSVFDCISVRKTVGAVAHGVEVDAITTLDATLATFLYTRVLDSVRSAKSFVVPVHDGVESHSALVTSKCASTHIVATGVGLLEIVTSDNHVAGHDHHLCLLVGSEVSKVVLI